MTEKLPPCDCDLLPLQQEENGHTRYCELIPMTEEKKCCEKCAGFDSKGEEAWAYCQVNYEGCCHQPTTEEDSWEAEFDRMWPNQKKSREDLMALFGNEYKPHTATEAAILDQAENKRRAFKLFIRRVVATAKEERDAFWEAQEMAVSSDCAEHEAKARQEGRDEAVECLDMKLSANMPYTQEELEMFFAAARTPNKP